MNSVNVARGFGKPIFALDLGAVSGILFLTFPTQTLTILASALSKTSFALTLLPFLHSRWCTVFLWLLIVSTHVAIDLGVVLLWAQCIPVEGLWNPVQQKYCWNPMTFYGYMMFSTCKPATYSRLSDPFSSH